MIHWFYLTHLQRRLVHLTYQSSGQIWPTFFKQTNGDINLSLKREQFRCFLSSYNSLIVVRQTQIFNFLGVSQFLRLSRFVHFHFLGLDQNCLLLLLYFTCLLTAVKGSSFFNFSIGFLWLCGKWSIVLLFIGFHGLELLIYACSIVYCWPIWITQL